MTPKRYLIIGDGAAGFTAAQTIRQNDPAAFIRIYADDPNPAYFRAALTNYLIGELREEQIWAVPPTFYHEFNIERIHARVAAVDTGRCLLHLENGRPPDPYDSLLIAAGSSAIRPSFPGGNLPGVMTMRTLQDVRQVIDLVRGQGGLRQTVIAGGRETCVTCHMPLISNQTRIAEPAAIPLQQDYAAPTRLVRDHSFVGADYPLDTTAGLDPQQEAREALLRSAAVLQVGQLFLDVGDQNLLTFEVSVTNNNLGHDLPTGFAFARQMWLEVVVQDEDGNLLFASGLLANNTADLCDADTLDDQGNPMIFYIRGCAASDPQLNLAAKSQRRRSRPHPAGRRPTPHPHPLQRDPHLPLSGRLAQPPTGRSHPHRSPPLPQPPPLLPARPGRQPANRRTTPTRPPHRQPPDR